MLRPLLALAVACTATVASAQSADPVDPLYTCKKTAPSTLLSASFAPELSLQDLATWVTGFTCKNIIFSADVAKHATKVTVIAPNKMTAKQALALFVDAVEATGLVVQQKPDTIIIKLGKDMPKGCPDVASVHSTVAPTPTPKPSSVVPVEEEVTRVAIEKGVKQIDATHYEVTAEAFEQVLANPMALAKGARVVPATTNGVNGFKLYAVRPSSLYAKVGLTNGDILEKVNGYSLDSADKALELYAKLREAKIIEMQILRRGKPVTISIKIKR